MMPRLVCTSFLTCAALLPPQGAQAQPRAAGAGEVPRPSLLTRVDAYGDPLPDGAWARLGTVRLRPGATCLTFSPDGKVLVTGGDSLHAWDVATGKRIDWFEARASAVAVRYSPDGKTLSMVDDTGVIRQWLHGKPSPVRTTGSSLRGRLLVTGGLLSADTRVAGVWGDAGQVRLWEAATGSHLLDFKARGAGLSYFSAAALSPDGKTVAVRLEGNRALLIDVATGKELRQVEGPNKAPHLAPGFLRIREEAIYWLTFSPDGLLLAGSGKDYVTVWDVSTGKVRYTVRGDSGRLAFSPDGMSLACGGQEAIRLLETATGKELRCFEHPCWFIHALAFSPDGRTLAAAENEIVSLWDVATGERLHTYPAHESAVGALRFSPDGASLASGDSHDGTLIIWDLQGRKPRRFLRGHFPGVASVAFSPDGKVLATGDGYRPGESGNLDAKIRLWGALDGRLLRQFPGHLAGVHSLAFAPDGRTLASAGHDARAKVWEVATGTRLYQIRGADSHYKSVAFAPDGKTLLVAGTNAELALWKADTGQKVCDLGNQGGERRLIVAAAFLPDGKGVLAMEDAEVRVWDGPSGRLLRSFPSPNSHWPYAAHALSPDGKMLAATHWHRGGAIELRDTVTGETVGRLGESAGTSFTALAFSPDGRTLAAGCSDTTVLLWEVAYARLNYLWSELTSGTDDAAKLARDLTASAEGAVPFLQQRLRRVAEVEGRVNLLIDDLDADSFAVREKASGALERLGPEAGFALRLALQGSPGPEVRRRIETILDRMTKPGGKTSAVEPRSVWLSLAILEEMGTAQARRALEELADAKAKSAVGREAAAALKRLAKRRRQR
jgi:WD40 repeat protein